MKRALIPLAAVAALGVAVAVRAADDNDPPDLLRLGSTCPAPYDVWTLTNPRSEDANTNIGVIPANSSVDVPAEVEKVEAAWPSINPVPVSYYRVDVCVLPPQT